jgi:hypothetical protein
MKEYILRFDIAMEYIVIVHELNGVADLLDHIADPLLPEPALVLEVVVEVAGVTELHQQIEIVVLHEHRI